MWCVCCRPLVATKVHSWQAQFNKTMQALEQLVCMDVWLAHTGRQMQVGSLQRVYHPATTRPATGSTVQYSTKACVARLPDGGACQAVACASQLHDAQGAFEVVATCGTSELTTLSPVLS